MLTLLTLEIPSGQIGVDWSATDGFCEAVLRSSQVRTLLQLSGPQRRGLENRSTAMAKEVYFLWLKKAQVEAFKLCQEHELPSSLTRKLVRYLADPDMSKHAHEELRHAIACVLPTLSGVLCERCKNEERTKRLAREARRQARSTHDRARSNKTTRGWVELAA